MVKKSQVQSRFNGKAQASRVTAQQSLEGFCARVTPRLSEDDTMTLERLILDFRSNRPTARAELTRQVAMINDLLRIYGLAVQNVGTGFVGHLSVTAAGGVVLRRGGGNNSKLGGFSRASIRLVPIPGRRVVRAPVVDLHIPP